MEICSLHFRGNLQRGKLEHTQTNAFAQSNEFKRKKGIIYLQNAEHHRHQQSTVLIETLHIKPFGENQIG